MLNCCDTTFTFQEPIDIAVDKSYGHILVADNGQSCVFVFDSDGKILFQVYFYLFVFMKFYCKLRSLSSRNIDRLAREARSS